MSGGALAGDPGLHCFLEAWRREFAKAGVVLWGESPDINCGRARHLREVDVETLLWWSAMVTCDRSFQVWIGAREKTWSTAGKLQWIRVLERVQSATLQSISVDLVKPALQGPAQLVHEAPDPEHLCYAVMGIKLVRTELPALLFAIDPLAREELILKETINPQRPIPEPLLNLELPLSVALGRTKLPIGEVLKITSGSVIHLQGHTGAEVEILVHGAAVARGQVVSHKGNYGVRIQQIISASDRMKLCATE